MAKDIYFDDALAIDRYVPDTDSYMLTNDNEDKLYKLVMDEEVSAWLVGSACQSSISESRTKTLISA